MDTSKEYILMCENAGEIQNCHKEIRCPDIFARQNSIYCMDEENHHHIFLKYIEKHIGNKLIWLPRQDQLQGMVKDRFSNVMVDTSALQAMLKYFNDFRYINKQYDSMEQLWLAFVMKEKYNKIWTGKEWEAQDGGE